jgi:hypothetical protein
MHASRYICQALLPAGGGISVEFPLDCRDGGQLPGIYPLVLLTAGSVASATWAATDAHSGLAGPSSRSVALNTSAAGQNKTAAVPAGGTRDNVGHDSPADTCGYDAVYDFNGFFAPLDNPPVLNESKAGHKLPLRFSLAGDQRLAIIEAGYPKSQQIPCSADASVHALRLEDGQGYAVSCRQATIKLDDGRPHQANFEFVK